MPPARFSTISPPVWLNVTLVTVAGSEVARATESPLSLLVVAAKV